MLFNNLLLLTSFPYPQSSKSKKSSFTYGTYGLGTVRNSTVDPVSTQF